MIYVLCLNSHKSLMIFSNVSYEYLGLVNHAEN